MEADFSGWATKVGIECTDGRTIMRDAFKHQDTQRVPLVWQHGHKDPENVLGHVVLENRSEGVYCYGYFNDTPKAKNTKLIVEHKDVEALSIWANKLKEQARSVIHGSIREVSLVLSGANPGALIDQVRIAHGDGTDDYDVLEDEAFIYTGLPLEHEAGPSDELTVQDVYDSMTDEQKLVVAHMVETALEAQVQHADEDNKPEGEEPDGDKPEGEEPEGDKPEGDKPEGEQDGASEGDDAGTTDDTKTEDSLDHQEGSDMTRNVFDQSDADTERRNGPTLSHDQLSTIVDDGWKMGSFKESLLAHAEEYGITNIELLFPEARMIDNKPEWITRRMEWVTTVLGGVRKLPYSRIKSMSADLTHEEARAKGYIKATMKKTQFFELAGRETTPKTIYKKQQLDRDDIVDITELDVVNWIWGEMRFMLNEEIARAILVGDGREPDDPDKINENNIRPIAQDATFYTDVVDLPANISPEALVETVIRSRELYKGAGNPDAFMTRSILNDMLLQKDKMGRRLYRNRTELAAELEVNSITDVPAMEGVTRDEGEIQILLVNLSDYSVGTTKGGEISTFDDFDIDYNQYKYLIEGRMSGALTKHKTAQVFVRADGTLVTADLTAPTFNTSTGVLTVPTQTGVVYRNAETDAVLTAGAQTAIAAGASVEVEAVPATGYYFEHNIDTDWSFTRNP